MAMDYTKRRALQKAAEALLKERYNEGRDPMLPLDPIKAMQEVRYAAGGHRAELLGEEPQDVPAEDVLAALTQADEARQRLDRLELGLIEAARARGASWQKIADHLGLGTRQSAETRALRLERAVSRYHHGGRDVAQQRTEKARQRTADAWCAEHEDRIQAVAERLIDVSKAWPQLTENPLATSYMHVLASTLTTSGSGPKMLQELASLKHTFAPYGEERLRPTGPRAAEANAAVDAMLALLDEVGAVRRAVHSSTKGARS
ncbi:hypothetical protein [Streptomyces chrestomyceticus]|uniref:hypothetical protein n=1 Tax=Streptomyces chrestomyceticus TaxID=68185 RepID=UPI003404774A